VLAREAGFAAHQIYANEVHGSKVSEDRRQVQTYAPLLQALSAGDNAAVQAAVTSLVYSHTHIVRLRVTTGSALRADVGGPYIIAPVPGTLSANGHTIGHYVLSVQDDLGYVKLVTRFIGVPLVLRHDSEAIPIQGLLARAPKTIPALGQITFNATQYAAYSFDAQAFPAGKLRVSLLVPLPASLQNETCAQVKAGEARTIARRTVRRYTLQPRSYYAYAAAVHRFTGARVFIHVGGRPVTGSSGHGPSHLPASGTIAVGGTNYRVESFHASGPVTVFLLVPE
jgi:hypothetical protein